MVRLSASPALASIRAASLVLMLFMAPALLAQSADLLVAQTAPELAAANTDVSFQISLLNVGADVATGVILDDPLPPGMTFVSLTQNSGPVFSCSDPGVGVNGTVTCTAPTLAVGATASWTLVAHITAGAPLGSYFVNLATARSSVFDSNSENDTGVGCTQIPDLAADLGVSIVGPNSSLVGVDISYAISAVNNGSDAATNAVIDIPLPPEQTFVSLQQLSGPSFVCSTPAPGAGGSINCTRATLAVGAPASFALVAHLNSAPVFGLTSTQATVTSATVDWVPDNNFSTATVNVSSADLAISKTAPASVIAGTAVVWTLTVTNGGPNVAANAQFSDPLPAAVRFASVSQTSGPVATCSTPAFGTSGTLTCAFGNLAVGASASFDISALTLPSGGGSALSNSASVTSFSADPSAANDSATAATTVGVSADLALSQTAPATVLAGTALSYALSVSNNGPSDAAGVALADTLPPGTGFASLTQTAGPSFSCSTPAVGAAGTVNCTRAVLPIGASAQFTLVVNAAPSLANGAQISNTALLSATSPDPNPVNNTAIGLTTVTTSADLALTKTAPATAIAGGQLSYTLTLSNTGPSDAQAVSLADTLPAGTSFAALTQTAGAAFSCTTPTPGSAGSVNCSVATLARGASASFSLLVNLSAASAGGSVVTNTASVATTTNDPTGINNTATAQTTVAISADIQITKAAPSTALAGGQVTYALTVSNAGPSDGVAVSLSDLLPSGTNFNALTQSAGPTFTCTTPATGAAGTVNCSIATLPAGASAVFALGVNVSASLAAGAALTNTATAGASSSDPNTGNNAASATSTITTSADLALTKTATATAVAGGPLTYTLTVSNAGPSDAATVTLTDLLPANLRFSALTQSSGPTFTCTTPAMGTSGMVSCTAPVLAAGASAQLALVVNLTASTPAGTALVNSAAVVAATSDPNSANNTASATTTATTSADLALTKTAPATAVAGGQLVYTLTLSNAGPSDAQAVALTDVLPAFTTFAALTQTSGPALNCTTPAPGSAGTVSCTAASFASGVQASLQLLVNVSAAATIGTALANTANISATTADPNPANAIATASAVVLPPPAPVPADGSAALLALAVALALSGATRMRSKD